MMAGRQQAQQAALRRARGATRGRVSGTRGRGSEVGRYGQQLLNRGVRGSGARVRFFVGVGLTPVVLLLALRCRC